MLIAEMAQIVREPEWFAGWGTLALINAALAQNRNRSGLNWFVASIFLGPLATFLLVAFFPRTPRIQKS